MRASNYLYVLALGLVGCGPTLHEQVTDLNQDGVVHLHHQNYDAARQSFQQALELDPQNQVTLYNVAAAAHRGGDYATAERCYRDCLELVPGSRTCRHGLALLMLQQDRPADAAHMVDAWLADHPELADAHAEKGWLLREQGDLPAAQERLHQALEIDSGNARALAELGIIYETYHYPERAYLLYERSLKRDPHQQEVVARFAKLRRPGYESNGREGEGMAKSPPDKREAYIETSNPRLEPPRESSPRDTNNPPE
jgi:tetratricopeptide (TPR) repeat protein